MSTNAREKSKGEKKTVTFTDAQTDFAYGVLADKIGGPWNSILWQYSDAHSAWDALRPPFQPLWPYHERCSWDLGV